MHLATVYTTLLVLSTGAAARLTRLVGTDTITAPLRAYLTRLTRSPKTAQVLSCPWCTGFWLSLTVVAVAWPIAGLPTGTSGLVSAVATVLTVSHLVGLLAALD